MSPVPKSSATCCGSGFHERDHFLWADPGVVVHARRCRAVYFRTDVVAQFRVPRFRHQDRAKFTRVRRLDRLNRARAAPRLQPGLRDPSIFPRRLHHQPAFAQLCETGFRHRHLYPQHCRGLSRTRASGPGPAITTPSTSLPSGARRKSPPPRTLPYPSFSAEACAFSRRDCLFKTRLIDIAPRVTPAFATGVISLAIKALPRPPGRDDSNTDSVCGESTVPYGHDSRCGPGEKVGFVASIYASKRRIARS